MTLGPDERLRILNSLPKHFQDFAFDEIKKRCKKSQTFDVPWDALFSQVMAWFVGALKKDEAYKKGDAESFPQPKVWRTHETDPAQDERVLWVINCAANWKTRLGRRAGAWRDNHDEVLRRYGKGHTRDASCHSVPVDMQTEFDNGGHQDEGSDEISPEQQLDLSDADVGRLAYEEAPDTKEVWGGLQILAEDRFSERAKGGDVIALLDVIRRRSDLGDAFNKVLPGRGKELKWPVSPILEALKTEYPLSGWTRARVENAQDRIERWISSMKQRLDMKNDPTRFRMYLAGVKRESSKSKRMSP